MRVLLLMLALLALLCGYWFLLLSLPMTARIGVVFLALGLGFILLAQGPGGKP